VEFRFEKGEKMYILFLICLCNAQLAEQLELFTTEYHGPKYAVICDLVEKLAIDAAKNHGKTHVIIKWTDLPPLANWTADKRRHIYAVSFINYWKSLHPDVVIAFLPNESFVLCWMGDTACVPQPSGIPDEWKGEILRQIEQRNKDNNWPCCFGKKKEFLMEGSGSQTGRDFYARNVKRWVNEQLGDARKSLSDAEKYLEHARFLNIQELNDLERVVKNAHEKVIWFEKVLCGVYPPLMYTSDKQYVSEKITSHLKRTVSCNGPGPRDSRPFVVVSSHLPLFKDDLSICVLNVSYAHVLPEEQEDAVRYFCIRLLGDLILGQDRWSELINGCPITDVKSLQDILGLNTSQVPLLIYIDEISGLSVKTTFWQKLYSLTRASENWIRIVMTSIPRRTVASSDIACEVFD
jgi:hypothetical protein